MAPLPLSYYRRFLERLRSRGDIEFITYNDLVWEDDRDYHHRYPDEWKRWQAALAGGRLSRDKIYLLVQHDTDRGPAETMRMAQVERDLGIPSSIMTFVRWRRGQKRVLQDYPIDWAGLKALEAEGFCIGYHCNAMHNANFDAAIALDMYREELATISSRFDLKFFSTHGGDSGPNGEINSSIDYPATHPGTVRWVHNRFSPRFDSTFSDGGTLHRLEIGDTTTDLRAWFEGLRPGRHRALLHPQIYDDATYAPYQESVSKHPSWYREFVALAAGKGPDEASSAFWARARMDRAPSFLKASVARLFRGLRR